MRSLWTPHATRECLGNPQLLMLHPVLRARRCGCFCTCLHACDLMHAVYFIGNGRAEIYGVDEDRCAQAFNVDTLEVWLLQQCEDDTAPGALAHSSVLDRATDRNFLDIAGARSALAVHIQGFCSIAYIVVCAQVQAEGAKLVQASGKQGQRRISRSTVAWRTACLPCFHDDKTLSQAYDCAHASVASARVQSLSWHDPAYHTCLLNNLLDAACLASLEPKRPCPHAA